LSAAILVLEGGIPIGLDEFLKVRVALGDLDIPVVEEIW